MLAMVERFLDQGTTTKINGKILGVIAPHAGYAFSGAVAGKAFALLQSIKPETVIVLSPFHAQHSSPLLTSGHAAYGTPLGNVPVDRAFLDALNQKLLEASGVGLHPVRNDREHALEIELPFLQVLFTDFRLVPLMLHTHRPHQLKMLGEILAALLVNENTLIVASSDLSHFFPEEVARILDGEILRRVCSLDPETVLSAESEGAGFACGIGAIAALIWAVRSLGANRAAITGYATSGEINANFTSVVGYGSVVLWQEEK